MYISRSSTHNKGGPLHEYLKVCLHLTTISVVDDCGLHFSLLVLVLRDKGKSVLMTLLAQLCFKMQSKVLAMVSLLWLSFVCSYSVALRENFKAKAWERICKRSLILDKLPTRIHESAFIYYADATMGETIIKDKSNNDLLSYSPPTLIGAGHQ